MLANDRSGMGRFLRSPAFQPSGNGTHEPQTPPHPARIGSYEIVRCIGEGGMGVVYEARQANPRRTVAIKVLRSPLPSAAMLERFRHEAQALAHLRHAGLAHIYEAGVTEVTLAGGVRAEQPYFVMEFVEGTALCEFASSRALGPRERLELMARVCDAVQHAHEKGVIHRDLKPENVLVVEEGTQAQRFEGGTKARRQEGAKGFGGSLSGRSCLHALPKVLDFGVARLSIGDGGGHTKAGELVGTLAYMSPEQACGDAALVDTRSDVYSLGVMIYQLLAGRLPHELRDVPLVEAARRIREEPPPPLSTFARSFRGDVETLVARAMHKDRERRYESAAALAADIRRHLNGEPIDARRDSPVYVLGKTLHRYRWPVAACCLLVVGLAGFAVFAERVAEQNMLLARQEQQARKQAEAATALARSARDDEAAQRAVAESEMEHAQSVTGFLVEVLDLADPDVTQRSDLTVREVLERASTELDGAFDDRPEAEATLRTVIGRAYAALGEPQVARRHLERALTLREKRLNAGPADLYEVMWPLTHVLSDLSDTLAHARAGRCDRTGRQAIAETLPELAAACERLARLMTYEYPDEQARAALSQVLRIAGESLPDGDERWILVADQLFFCGLFLAPRRHPEPACGYFEQAMAIYRRMLPETNTRIVRTLGHLLTCQIAAGRDVEAEQAANKSLALIRETLPADHWYVALCKARLGACLIGQQRFDEAEPLLLEGYERVVAARGATGRLASEILRSLVRLDDDAGRPERAARHREALAAAIAGSPEYTSWVTSEEWGTCARSAFGPEQDSLIELLEQLKSELRNGGPSAGGAIAAAIDSWESLLPDEHPLSALIAEVAINWLAYETKTGVPAEALLNLSRKAVRVARASPALHPRKRAFILAQAGIQFRRQEQFLEAEGLLRGALAILESGYDSYAFADWVKAQLGVVLVGQGRFDEAEPWLLSGYQGLLDYGGPATGDTRGALRHLLDLYERTGRLDRLTEIAAQDVRQTLDAPDVRPSDQYSAAWRVVRAAGHDPETYALALQLAQRAVAALPEVDGARRTLAAALYRTGQYPAALEAVRHADELASKSRRGRRARDQLLMAMIQHRLGDEQAADAALREARRMLTHSPRHSEVDRWLLAEAEALAATAAGG